MAGPAPLTGAGVGLNAGIAEATAGSHQPCQSAVSRVRGGAVDGAATGGGAAVVSVGGCAPRRPVSAAGRAPDADAAAAGYSGAKSDGGRETSAVVPEPGVTLSPTLMPCRVASRATTWNPAAATSPTSMSGGDASSALACSICSAGMPRPQSSMRDEPAAGAGPVGPGAHRDGGVRRREAHGVLGELGQQVREVDDGVPDHGALLVDDEHDALEVLGLCDGRAQHVAQRHGLAPRARGLLAREHEQVLRVAPHPGGDVIEREQVGERIGVALRLLELVDDLQLPVQEALVAAGEVGEQVGRELAPVDLGIGEPAAQHVLLALRVFGDPQHEERSGAGDQHRHAVDQRPQPGVLLPLDVVEDQCLLPRRADPVADHGEDDVDEERRPVLVERDEADDDEEVEVRLDGAVR